MKMDKVKITEHAQKRMQQRAINELQIKLIQNFGVYQYQKGGANYGHIPERVLADLRRAIDKIANVSVVFGDSDSVVTALHETRRVRKTQYKS